MQSTLRLSFIAASLLFMGAACDRVEPEAIQPPSATGPLSTYQRNAYNGARPLYANGNPIVIYNTRIIGAETDTILFNQLPFSHRPELRREVGMYRDITATTPDAPVKTVMVSYKSTNKDDYDLFVLLAPARVGIYKAPELKSPDYGWQTAYEVGGSDFAAYIYKLNPTADNWIEIKQIDPATKRVAGRYDLYFILAHPKPTVEGFSLIYPNTIHLSGSFAY